MWSYMRKHCRFLHEGVAYLMRQRLEVVDCVITVATEIY